jgi:hypothetical protein
MSPSSPADVETVLRDASRRALARPWLLAPPLAGAFARREIAAALAGSAGAAAGTLVGALLTIAACAAFAELWLSEDGRFDFPRVGAALALYVLPMLALACVGLVAAELFASVATRALLVATFVAGKLCSGGATVLASFALARWSRERGLPGALRAGASLLAARPFFSAALVLGSWIAQEGLGAALGAGLGSMPGAGPAFFRAFGVLGEALVAGVALAGCVALPLQAAAEAR